MCTHDKQRRALVTMLAAAPVFIAGCSGEDEEDRLHPSRAPAQGGQHRRSRLLPHSVRERSRTHRLWFAEFWRPPHRFTVDTGDPDPGPVLQSRPGYCVGAG